MSKQYFCKKLDEKILGQGHRGSLVRVSYTFDLKEENSFYFENYLLRASAAILPIDDNGNVYLLNEFVPPVGEWQIGLARGGIEKGETPENAARRELQEEMGMSCRDLIPLWAGYAAPNCTDWHYTLFLGRGDIRPIPKEGGDEMYQTDVVKMPLADALQKARQGEIKSSAAVIAILMAEHILRSEQKPK